MEVQGGHCDCMIVGGTCGRREEGKGSTRQVWTFEKEDVAMMEAQDKGVERGAKSA
jgi:hypothetical protein